VQSDIKGVRALLAWIPSPMTIKMGVPENHCRVEYRALAVPYESQPSNKGNTTIKLHRAMIGSIGFGVGIAKGQV
jgi:hypothetical protein